MKVVFISYDYGEYCVRLASALAAQCHVRLLLSQQLAAPHLAKLDGRVDFQPFHKPRLRQPAAQMRNTWQLVRRIREFEPDVIHLQDGQLWFNLALPLLARYPLVVTVHDVERHVGDRESQRVPRPIMDLAPRRADEVIVHAPPLKAMIDARLGIDPERTHVIPHVKLGEDAQPAEIEEEHPWILFFGRIWPYKGLEYLIRAEPAITRSVPEARIIIAGEGEDFTRYREMMVHPEHFVVLNTFVSDQQRAELFARASVVVLPYIDASQSGVIPIAYSAGKPVVATTVGGLPAVVDDGVTGYLVPPCDEAALAQAVVRLLRDPDLRRRMGSNARHKVDTEYSASTIASQLQTVYAEAMRHKGGV